ncbi:pantoate--beta-alanine ligase [Flavobacteriaceae bacterium]|nr:pantoate--beta-alanine ligase [Flavobacteriaceae bacterium]MDB9874225.1 pantoate--beta-alanine ligase [Flavobacteriaceae bacterium]MDC1265501.1 pantoate--beta-alanine ligase [Flavobacteriaceae bacterium]
MRVYTSKAELRTFISKESNPSFSLGFVPTMGALHTGHLSLVSAALAENTLVVVSIFVNPTQFDNPNDLSSYPRTLTEDIQLLETLSKTHILVYAPTVEDVYGSQPTADHFDFGGLEFQMEGKFRTGHFDGVGTIVKRLFEIVKPNNAYFGEKDFQQLQIIKKMVEITRLPVKIIGCPIERESNGLAMSSRNSHLSVEEKEAAALIYQTLQSVKEKFQSEDHTDISNWVNTQFSNHPLFELEYFQISESENLAPIQQKNQTKTYRAFIAVFAGDVRLIDNIALN